ncbi:MAG TPA: tetratricopeptide repeat protein [Longimicrobium sp.]|nr:tetratricopeptide repeat protein [Longimicrobium sp.]
MAARARRSNRPRAADFTTPLTIPGGAVGGADVVRELAPDVALPVWQTLRSVLMWAGEEPALRGDLFEPCAMEEWEAELLMDTWEPDVRCPLAVLVGELARAAEASAETLARTCLCVTDWALERGHVATALAFAEAAALSWPQQSRYSWMAGRLLRIHGRPKEAEQWLKRAERAASTSKDWEARTLALNSLGNTYAEAGNYKHAIQMHTQALRVAKKHGLREREGEVLHDLFVATAYSGSREAAEEHARGALEVYRSGHPRLLALAHDVAVLWMQHGQFSRALPVFLEISGHFTEPHERLLVIASTARAAGACGEEELYTKLAQEAVTVEQQVPAARLAPRALYHLGLGAWSLNRWAMAEQFLMRAESAARERNEADVTSEAEAALSAVRQRQHAEQKGMYSERKKAGQETLSGRFVATLKSAPELFTEGVLINRRAA